MALPDIASIADALRQRPQDFVMQDARLRQRNGTLAFVIHPGGSVVAETGSDGDCHELPRQDAARLSTAFEEWQRDFWVSARVNQIFADQLRRPSIWRRVWYHIQRHLPERRGESALTIYARAFAGPEPKGRRPNDDPPLRHRPRPQRPTSGADLPRARLSLHLNE